MNTKQSTEATYELIGNDAMGWLEQAITLKLSADIILKELLAVLPQSQVVPGIREKKLACIRSFMLLTGLAFENLIKGIFVARYPNLVSKQKMDTALWSAIRKGHGISTLAKQVTILQSAELDVLVRLEEYIVWAGRYPIPMNSNQYFQSEAPRNLRTFKSTDPALVNGLFERLSEILTDERRKTGDKSNQ